MRKAGYFLLLVAFILLVLEAFYRYQLIDTYTRELRHLNPDLEADDAKPAILVMGDSFSATRESWVGHLREALPDRRVVNSAVPGTTVIQAGYMARRRFNAFDPGLLIYQVYVGNDLFDLRYPAGGEQVGFLRKAYWTVANHLRSVAWLNYAMGQLRADPEGANFAPKDTLPGFDPDNYSRRARLYLEAEPTLIERSVLLGSGRREDFQSYLHYLDDLLSRCESGKCRALIVVVPHCAQLDRELLDRQSQVGARFDHPQRMLEAEYPFLRALRDHLAGRPHVQVLNPLPRLRRERREGRAVYYTHDPHLSPYGQEVLADTVLSVLRRPPFSE